MIFPTIINPEMFTWVIIPLLIFFARIIDVSLGTLRVIFISRGYKYLAPLVGFIEITIWLLAIRQVIIDDINIALFFAYAGGFAAGTFVGIVIEEKLSIGEVMLRIITGKDTKNLVKGLKKAGFMMTTVSAQGVRKKVKVVHCVVKREDVSKVLTIVKRYNPHAFYTVEDIRHEEKLGMEGRKNHTPHHYHHHSRKGK